jgi:hypothetical protein
MILASALTYFVNRKGGLGQASLLSGVLLRSTMPGQIVQEKTREINVSI